MWLWKNKQQIDVDSNRQVSTESNRSAVSTNNSQPITHTSEFVMVCAIDFGTTNTGFAYSLRDDPTKISCLIWEDTTSLMCHKIPTTSLLDKKQNFLAFGYEADRMYLDLVSDEEADDFFYFRSFQMILNDKIRTEGLSTNTKISDIKGKYLPAVDIFSHAIKYLGDTLYNELKRRFVEIPDRDIGWVLTVPADWDDSAKQFMREAAEKARIETNRLMIASESKAAYVLCKELPECKFEQESNSIGVSSPGKRYLVLNARERTVDITVHEVQSDGNLYNLCGACGGQWAGDMVIETFNQMLTDIVGKNFLNKYCNKFTADYSELLKDFENKMHKTKVGESESERITLKISASFLDEYKNEFGRAIAQRTKETIYASSLNWLTDKIQIRRDLFESFFKPSCEKIVDNIRKILADQNLNDTKMIIMVGSFSDSKIVQETVRKAFPECRIVIPKDAGLAVLKGAVISGHDTSRVNDEDSSGIEISNFSDAKNEENTNEIEPFTIVEPNYHEPRTKGDKKLGCFIS